MSTARPRSRSRHTNIIQEVDVLSAPMEIAHKHLVLRHFRSLRKIIDEPDEDTIGEYTSKQAAREQLARMTLVFRDYGARRKRGEIDETCESMVADVVDASFAIGGRRGTYDQPVFASALLMGREQEIAALMQERDAGDVDEVIELWHAPPRKENVLPDKTNSENVAADIDWTSKLMRCKSEDNITYDHEPRGTIIDRPKFIRQLSQQDPDNLKYTWPPSTPEEKSHVGRTRASTADWEEWISPWKLHDMLSEPSLSP